MNAPTLLLTREELEQLTGTMQPKRMCDWLLARGWVFEPPARRAEIPKVDRAYYSARMSGTAPERPAVHVGGESMRVGRLRLEWMTSPTQ